MDAEIRAIMAQYMPLDKEAELGTWGSKLNKCLVVFQSYMDAEIRAIMAQYMPLDKEAEDDFQGGHGEGGMANGRPLSAMDGNNAELPASHEGGMEYKSPDQVCVCVFVRVCVWYAGLACLRVYMLLCVRGCTCACCVYI
jgi:hypothetical protein